MTKLSKFFPRVLVALLTLWLPILVSAAAFAASPYYSPVGAGRQVVYQYYTPARSPQSLADQIGVCHTDGLYAFTSEPHLLEGARAIREMGSRVIKVFLQHPYRKYPFNSSWPSDMQIPNIVDVLRTNYFRALFEMDFSVFVLQAHIDTIDSNYWMDGINANEYRLIENNYYQAARHLLTTYANRPVKFILEHWEAELYYRLCMNLDNRRYTPEQHRVAQSGLLTYFAARHEGVARARVEVGNNSMAQVFSAVEVIWVSTHASEFRLIDHMHNVKADYIAYSAGAECGSNTQAMISNLAILKSRLGARPFYIGELQLPESDFSSSEARARAVISQTNTALQEGSRFVLIWQIYENELRNGRDAGYALIRRDGSKTALYTNLASMLNNTAGRIDETSSFNNDVITKDFFTRNFGQVQKWLEQRGPTAHGAEVILRSDLDFRPYRNAGWVMHTPKVRGGEASDTSARKGDIVSIFIPKEMPAFRID